MSLRDEYGWFPTPQTRLRREPPIPPCPLPSFFQMMGRTNPACGIRRNLRVTAVTVLDFFRPLRFPRFASSSPGSAKLVYPPVPSREPPPLFAAGNPGPAISEEIEGCEFRIKYGRGRRPRRPACRGEHCSSVFRPQKSPVEINGGMVGFGAVRGAGSPKGGVSRTECRVSDTAFYSLFFILYSFFFQLQAGSKP